MRQTRARRAVPVLGRFRVNLDHPTLDALDLGGAETGLALGADSGLVLTVSRLKAVVLAGWRYQRTSFPVCRDSYYPYQTPSLLPAPAQTPPRPLAAAAERLLRAVRLCEEPGQHRTDPLRTLIYASRTARTVSAMHSARASDEPRRALRRRSATTAR